MEIKTIARKFSPEGRAEFDNEVNAALAEGWRLTQRKTLPGQLLGGITYPPTVYAELVKLDPPPVEEPKTIDPLEALAVIRETCKTAKTCDCPSCPVWHWCHRGGNGVDVAPSHWVIQPEKGGE